MANKGIKISDSSPQMTIGSKADEYWSGVGVSMFFERIRPKLDLPANLKGNDLSNIIKKFNIAGISFGNWVTIEDRINYTYSLILAFYDLNKILKFKYNIGMGVLGIAFGARGSGSALAHYESNFKMINITRYSKGDLPKEIRFFGTGGLGSLAHEYGHFLDYFCGEYLCRNNQFYALTNGRSLSKQRTNTGMKMRDLVDDILEMIIWKKPNELHSNYYNRLLETIGDSEKGQYWIRRNELFARAFEVYCLVKLEQLGIKNLLLVHSKYSESVYLRKSEIASISKKFDELFGIVRKLID